MTWLNEEIAHKWREEGKRYAHAINHYLLNPEQVPPDPDTRAAIAPFVMKMIEEANDVADFKQLHEMLPTASWPLVEANEAKTQAIKPIVLLNSGEAIVQTETGINYLMSTETIEKLPSYRAIGVSPDQQLLAFLDKSELRIIKDWRLKTEQIITVLNWADVLQQINAMRPLTNPLNELQLKNIIPFDEGNKLVLVSNEGIFLIANDSVECLYPEPSSYDVEDLSLDMVHANVSKNGRWLAYGCQTSEHFLKDLQDGMIYKFEPESSYPHYAQFSYDEENVWFNACHFYNGVTIRVPLAEALAKGKKGQFADWPIMDEDMRVYASVALQEGQILGDAYGYLRLISNTGEELWNHFLGSTISGIAISPNAQQLVVGTYGGFLYFIDLIQKAPNEYQIGNANLTETGSWIIFKNAKPLRW